MLVRAKVPVLVHTAVEGPVCEVDASGFEPLVGELPVVVLGVGAEFTDPEGGVVRFPLIFLNKSEHEIIFNHHLFIAVELEGLEPIHVGRVHHFVGHFQLCGGKSDYCQVVGVVDAFDHD